MDCDQFESKGLLFPKQHFEQFERRNKTHMAYFYTILSNFIFALLALIVNFLKDVPPPLLSYYRSCFALMLILPICMYNKHEIYSPNQRVQNLLLLRASVCGLTNTLWMYVLQMLPLSEVQTILSMHPFFMGLMAYIFLDEKFTRLNFVCLVTSFFGIVLIAKPESIFGYQQREISYSLRLAGIFISLFISWTYSVEGVILRKLKNTSNALVHLVYFSLGNVIIAPIFLVADAKP